MEKYELFLNLLKVSDYAKPKRTSAEKKKDEISGIKLNLSSKIILIILLKDEKVNQRNISKQINLTAQGVSELIKKLEENQLVFKATGLSHNENLISLTEKGRDIAKLVSKQIREDAEYFFQNSSLSREETLILNILIDKIINNPAEK